MGWAPARQAAGLVWGSRQGCRRPEATLMWSRGSVCAFVPKRLFMHPKTSEQTAFMFVSMYQCMKRHTERERSMQQWHQPAGCNSGHGRVRVRCNRCTPACPPAVLQCHAPCMHLKLPMSQTEGHAICMDMRGRMQHAPMRLPSMHHRQ